MSYEEEEDTNTYLVVRNNEDQFSIWVKDRVAPNSYKCHKEGGNMSIFNDDGLTFDGKNPYADAMELAAWQEKHGDELPGKEDIVFNYDEDHYLPMGWTCQVPDADNPGQTRKFEGNKAECLAYVEKVWTDMRPRSLRLHMEANEKVVAVQ